MSNGSIATARITNCARSTNAVVCLYLKLHINLHDENNLELFREAVDNHVADNPRIWDIVVYFRCEDIDPDYESVIYKLAVRSRHSWQLAPRVLQNRAELRQFCVKLADKMKVRYDSVVPRRVLYYGGALKQGGVSTFKKDLVRGPNIHSSGDLDPFAVPPQHGRSSSEPARFSKPDGEDEIEGLEETMTMGRTANNLFLSMLRESHG